MEEILVNKQKQLHDVNKDYLSHKNTISNINYTIQLLKKKPFFHFKEKVKLYNITKDLQKYLDKKYELKQKKNKLIQEINNCEYIINYEQEMNNKRIKLQEYKIKCIEKKYIYDIIKYIYLNNEKNVLYNYNIIYDDYMLSLLKENIILED